MLFNDETKNSICGLPVVATPGTLRRVNSQATDFQEASQGIPWGAFFVYDGGGRDSRQRPRWRIAPPSHP